MGKMPYGINGPIIGKVGAAVGSSWKGIPYLKGKYKSRTTTITDKEKANREKFKKAQLWLSPLLDFVRVGFKGYTSTLEGFSAAKSYLMKNAMDSEGNIDPSKMFVSFGDLEGAENISVKKTSDDELLFSWSTMNISNIENNQDQVMLLAYDVQRKLVRENTAGEFRKTGSTTLKTHFPSEVSCHIWFALISADRTRRSNSVYLGVVNL